MDSPSAASAVEQATSYAADLSQAPAAAADLESTVRQLTRPLRSSGAPDDLARGTPCAQLSPRDVHTPADAPRAPRHKPKRASELPLLGSNQDSSAPRAVTILGKRSALGVSSRNQPHNFCSARTSHATRRGTQLAPLRPNRASGANGARQGYQLIAIPCRNSKCIVRTSSPMATKRSGCECRARARYASREVSR